MPLSDLDHHRIADPRLALASHQHEQRVGRHGDRPAKAKAEADAHKPPERKPDADERK